MLHRFLRKLNDSCCALLVLDVWANKMGGDTHPRWLQPSLLTSEKRDELLLFECSRIKTLRTHGHRFLVPSHGAASMSSWVCTRRDDGVWTTLCYALGEISALKKSGKMCRRLRRQPFINSQVSSRGAIHVLLCGPTTTATTLINTQYIEYVAISIVDALFRQRISW